jgi:hypothetical protein
MRSKHVQDRLNLLLVPLEPGNQTGKVRQALQILITSGMLRALDGTDDRIEKAHGNRFLLGDSIVDRKQLFRELNFSPLIAI